MTFVAKQVSPLVVFMSWSHPKRNALPRVFQQDVQVILITFQMYMPCLLGLTTEFIPKKPSLEDFVCDR